MTVNKTDERYDVFARQYAIDFNGTRAAIEAGFSEKSAAATASKLLKNAKIQEKIQGYLAAKGERADISADRIVEEVAAMGLSDITEVLSFGSGGVVLKESGTLPPRVTRAIQSIRVDPCEYGDRVTVKMHSKDAAISKLVQLLGFDRESAIKTVLSLGYEITDPTTGKKLERPN